MMPKACIYLFSVKYYKIIRERKKKQSEIVRILTSLTLCVLANFEYYKKSKLTFFKKFVQNLSAGDTDRYSNIFIHQFPASFQNYEGFENEYNAMVFTMVRVWASSNEPKKI